MQYKTEDAFSKAYKEGTRHRAYLLHGSENYLIERWARQLGAGGGDLFHLHRFSGRKLDVDTLYEAVESIPLMAQEKVVLIDDIDWKGMPAVDQDKLTEILADLPDDCTLIVTAKSPGFDGKSAAGKKLIALFDKAGCAVTLGARSGSAQVSFLKSEAKRHGCTISSDLCRYLLEHCETDMNSLRQEMHKLCLYSGGGELTLAQAQAVCTPKVEAKVYDLRTALLSGNIQRAMELLDNLFYLRESAVMILSVLIRVFVDLYRARIAREEGKEVPHVVETFGYKGREFVVRNAFSSSAKLSTIYLRKALDVLLACDRALKSSPADDRVLLEQAVTELFVLAQKHR